MSARLPDETREQLLAELALHERYALKAIAARHGVSRQLLWKLRDQMRRESEKPRRGPNAHMDKTTIDAAQSVSSIE